MNPLRPLLALDWVLLPCLCALAVLGMLLAYSAGNASMGDLQSQAIRVGVAFAGLLVVSQVSPQLLARLAPGLYALGLAMLVWVAASGAVGGGAQRWLDLGFMRFQPSELVKLTVPMMVAWYLSRKLLPPNRWQLVVGGLIILVPAGLIVRQPDLGTALLVCAAGGAVLFLGGLGFRFIGMTLLAGLLAMPLAWQFLRDYQRRRILTLLNPEQDPMGAGYHVIQAKIAVGSGGPFGKGWMQGTQAHLDFIPESSTDFIFAVFAEEFGFSGSLALLLLYVVILLRGFAIAAGGQDTFSRLFGGSLVVTFFVYLFVNIGMVIGILPVVGVPLPLVSFGGTSMVTLMLGMGMLMAIRNDRRLWSG